jgi:hypothetical protein
MDTGSILGLSTLRPSFLDDVSSAQTRHGQADRISGLIKNWISTYRIRMSRYLLDDDIDPDEDDFDEDDDEDSEDDDEDDGEEDDDTETWQVSARRAFR